MSFKNNKLMQVSQFKYLILTRGDLATASKGGLGFGRSENAIRCILSRYFCKNDITKIGCYADIFTHQPELWANIISDWTTNWIL